MKLKSSALDDQFSASIAEILESNSLCTMATVAPDRSPHVNTAYFCFDETLDIYVLTKPSSRHSRNIEVDSKVAVTIFDSKQPWGQPHRGLQIIGNCEQVQDQDCGAVLAVYADRFPEVANLVPAGADFNLSLESRFYRITPYRLRLTDEERFGEETYFDFEFGVIQK